MADSIFDRIMNKYQSFTKAELKVADYLLTHRAEVQYMTISELAGACAVAEATLTRFGRTLECKGFNDLKLAIAQSSVPDSSASAFTYYGEVLPEDSIEQKCQKLYSRNVETLKQTMDMLEPAAIDRAVSICCKAKSIYCFGQGNSNIIAMEAWGRFSLVSSAFHWVVDSHMQAVSASLLEPDDAILYFSYSGSTRAGMEIADLVKRHKLKLILVTRFPNAPVAKLADTVIICGANESPLQQGSISAKLAQLYIIDVLFNEYCSRNLDTSVQNRKKTSDAISPKLL